MLRSAFFLCVALVLVTKSVTSSSSRSDLIKTCSDEKCFKNLLKTVPNLLVMFAKSDEQAPRDIIRLFKSVALEVKSFAAIAYVSCADAKKLCKKQKLAQLATYELRHYSDGKLNRLYDRALVKKSMMNFLRDPKADLPWEEEDGASQQVIHLANENELDVQLKERASNGILVMFYAPWCGFCKKFKPDFSDAAAELSSNSKDVAETGVLAAIDLDRQENARIKERFNITGFPTLLYFVNGKVVFPYGGEHTKQSLISWMREPHAPKEKEPEVTWEDEMKALGKPTNVDFLNSNEEFDSYVETNPGVLVMFYAPWCGHCKTMKPVLNKVAERLTTESKEASNNKIAFVDCTKATALAQRFGVKGYPTVKYFRDGKFAWDYTERDEQKIVDYLKQADPKRPAVSENDGGQKKEPEWKDMEDSYVLHPEASQLVSTLKTKKHALLFMYAPWCGACKASKPDYTRAANHYREDTRIAFVALDCTQFKETCDQYKVTGYPTILYFNFGKGNGRPFTRSRDFAGFVGFMDSFDPVVTTTKAPSTTTTTTTTTAPKATTKTTTAKATTKKAKAKTATKGAPKTAVSSKDFWKDVPGAQHVRLLDDELAFEQYLSVKRKVLVLFYGPNCGHCKSLKTAYGAAASEVTSFVPGSYLAAVDATLARKLAKRFKIGAFPTLKYFEESAFKFDYTGGREKSSIVNFIRDPKPAKPAPTKTEL